jgi:hypothetical protein
LQVVADVLEVSRERVRQRAERVPEAVGVSVLPTDLVRPNRRIAVATLRPWTPVFTDGDCRRSSTAVVGLDR